jgi:hypothetical protein
MSENEQLLVEMFSGPTFRSPADEYDYRAESFVAEIPQDGRRFESRDELRAMQESFGDPPGVEVRRMVGEGDVWVVETIQHYETGAQFACIVVEFTDGKISRETRYYVPTPAA